MEQSEDPRHSLGLSVAFLLIVLAGALDLTLDAPDRWLSGHVTFEILFIAMSLGLSLHLFRRWRSTARLLRHARRTLAERRAERDAWRRSAEIFLEGLGRAIDRQFEQWGLTPAEREVALYLLKGYSHKRIARLTGRSERTVRQHAVAAYEKAGFAGRAELAGFFLEGLMLPRERTLTAEGAGEPG